MNSRAKGASLPSPSQESAEVEVRRLWGSGWEDGGQRGVLPLPQILLQAIAWSPGTDAVPTRRRKSHS